MGNPLHRGAAGVRVGSHELADIADRLLGEDEKDPSVPSAPRPPLAALCRVVGGDPAGGPLAARPKSDRFGWLVAPRSTILQAGDVHTGLTTDPAATLDRLFASLVAA